MTTIIVVYSASDQRWHRQARVGQAFGLAKEVNFFFFSQPLRPSQAAASTRHPMLGSRRPRLQELIHFPARRKDSFTPGASEVKWTSNNKEEKTADPICPVEAPPLPDDQHVTTSAPSPVKEEGDVTLNDADIPDSIARALFGALHEKRTGNQLPAMRILLARVGGSQLQQQWMATGREPSGLISLAAKIPRWAIR